MRLRKFAFGLLVLFSSLPAAAAEATLERVVIVERHGVRPPTKPVSTLSVYADAPWPQWPVAPGELTQHGADAMALMGQAMANAYRKAGLLGDGPCPAGVFVWSDSADQRTRASGDAILEGLGCTTPSHHLADGDTDPVFDGLGPFAPDAAERAKGDTEKRLAAVLATQKDAYAKGRAAMQNVLTPDGCGASKKTACAVGEGENRIVVKNGEVRLEGPLNVGSSLSETLLLEYSEGMALADVGWGRGAAALDEILPLHNMYADVVRQNPVLAAQRSGVLARQVVDLLNHRQTTGAAPVPADAKLVVFLGHDTNLSNLAGLFAMTWTLPGQPDRTAPGAAIAFELWRIGDGKRVVKTRILYQTLEETRALMPRDEPAQVVPTMADCPTSGCTLETFTQTFDQRFAAQQERP